MVIASVAEYLLEVLLDQLRLGHDELRQLVQDLVELDVVFVLRQALIVAQRVPQLSLAVEQLVEVSQEELQFADVAVLLVLPNALHEDLIDRLKAGNEVSVHVLHLRVLGQQLAKMRVGFEIVIVSHEVLSQEDARVEPAPHFRVNLFGVVHEFLEFLGECDHGFGECGQQLLHEVQILVVLLALDHDRLALEIIEGNLKVDLLELLHKPLSLLEFVEFHSATANQYILNTERSLVINRSDKGNTRQIWSSADHSLVIRLAKWLTHSSW